MKEYEKPKFLITKVSENDVITTSPGIETPVIDSESDGWDINITVSVD